MNRSKAVLILIGLILSAGMAAAQGAGTGGIKGKVRVKDQGPTPDVTVTVRQSAREVAHAVTDSKGEFSVTGLAPGVYGITLRKTGLSVGTLEDIKVKAGKTTALPDRLILTVNEASIARLWSSVFNDGGYSVPGVRIELARVQSDGTARKIDGRLTNETGQAVFRLSPDKATYRLTVKADGAEPQSKDVEIDGAMVYRVAFTIQRAPK
ncbi:MAG: carboxypeptidase-like regulatory domain-containing protein [Acidobacteriota bacterium]|nr:carboxypeptidase-like regulatory domain-containing protein [Acidobacteriota bacterium]